MAVSSVAGRSIAKDEQDQNIFWKRVQSEILSGGQHEWGKHIVITFHGWDSVLVQWLAINGFWCFF